MSGSSFFNAPKTVKVRKPHVCAYCGKTIPKGTAFVVKESGLWQGEFWERFACRECQPFIGEFWCWQGCESECIEDDFDEFMREKHRDLWRFDND